MVPFILFRRNTQTNMNTDAHNRWGLLPTLAKIANCHQRIDIIMRFAVDALTERGVLPFHMIHVEHCVNCADHKLTTRYVLVVYIFL
jgi:predicted DNA-binding transcriptional regulator YafY